MSSFDVLQAILIGIVWGFSSALFGWFGKVFYHWFNDNVNWKSWNWVEEWKLNRDRKRRNLLFKKGLIPVHPDDFVMHPSFTQFMGNQGISAKDLIEVTKNLTYK